MTLEQWLASKQEKQEPTPLEIAQRAVEVSLLREHMHLSEREPTACYCNLLKYGPECFDPAKMPEWWVGCGICGTV